MHYFGVGEFAARLPNAICGLVTLIILYRIGHQLYNARFGLIWSLTYFGSILPNLYFHSGIIDPWFNLFIFCGIYYFVLFHWKKNGYEQIPLRHSYWRYLFLGGFIIGMGILTKGQVAYLVACLTFFVYWIYQRFRFYVNVPQFLFFTLAATLVTLAWYGLETWQNGYWFVEEFNKYQYRLFSTPDAGHKGFPGYHFVVLLIGCFPASIFAIRTFFKMPEYDHTYQKDFTMWMKMLFWVVLILFTIVKSKIVHYSSLCYYPLTFLAALSLYRIVEHKIKLNRWLIMGTIAIGLIFSLATFALPFIGQQVEQLKPLFSRDLFAQANLDAAVHWTGWESIPGIWLFGILLTAFLLMARQRMKALLVLFIGTAVFINLTLYFSVGNIEHYSQRAAIEFFEEKSKEDCYVLPLGYKTYAHLFYGRRPKGLPVESRDFNWLMNNEVGKPVYFITKVDRLRNYEKDERLQEIGRKNGFVFYQKR